MLGGSASASAAALLSQLAQPAIARTRWTKHVLVLGAGMSGLAAALALLRAGHQVTVIERQNRIGGRLLSLPLGDGMFSEAGGGHFRSNMPYVLGYIRHFNLPVLSLNNGMPRYVIQGQTANAANLARWPWALTDEERNVSVSSNLLRYLHGAGVDTDTVLDTRLPDPETIERLSNISLRELLKGQGASDAFCSLLDVHDGPFSGGPALMALASIAYHHGDPALYASRAATTACLWRWLARLDTSGSRSKPK